MLLLLAFVLIVGALAVVAAAFAKDKPDGLSRALEALERSGHDASSLAQEADRSFTDRVLAPFQDRALTLGRRLTGSDKAERIRHRLDLAGNPRGWTVDRVLALKVVCAVLAPLLAVGYGLLAGAAVSILIVAAAAGVLLGFVGPDLYLHNKGVHRGEEIKKTLADAVDLLTISVEAGLGFDAAVQQVARNTTGPLADELSRVLREMQLGKSRSEALKSMGARSNVDDLNTFVGSMVQADAFGIPIAQVLRVQSGEIRVKRRQYAEEKAQQVPVKIMIPLILFILPCLFIVVMGPAVLSAMDAFNGK